MILKCKMCGGDIVKTEDQNYGVCDSCGTTVTLPQISDEQQANQFNRANHFRRQNEFDKAISAYEKILEQDSTNAEAHWGVVLSRFGIEYVEDPVSHQRIPTCNRVQQESILADADYLAALDNAPDGYTRSLYEEEGKRIAEIQKGILTISGKEEPYDVFICYKETNSAGSRTSESVLAQDIYYELTKAGYRVFFSRITLEDKLGREYEPYIFAALNSAKVMIVLGTAAENFQSVWVKNEWSRFLALMRKDRSKLLIPCYKDMDPYDLPEELSMLQSQDMSKIGFMQDLIRGIRKVVEKEEEKPAAAQTGGDFSASGYVPLLKRAQIYLEDGDFDAAKDYFERVLDLNPECAAAYWGELLISYKCKSNQGLLQLYKTGFDELLRQQFGMKSENATFAEEIKEMQKMQELQGIYRSIKQNAYINRNDFQNLDKISKGYTDYMPLYEAAQKAFEELVFWKNPLYEKVNRFANKEELAEYGALKEEIYNYISLKESDVQEKTDTEKAQCIENYIKKYEAELEKIKRLIPIREEQGRKKQALQAKLAANKKKIIIVGVIIIIAVVAAVVLHKVVVPKIEAAKDYEQGQKYFTEQNYDAAAKAFAAAGKYKDAEDQYAKTMEAKEKQFALSSEEMEKRRQRSLKRYIAVEGDGGEFYIEGILTSDGTVKSATEIYSEFYDVNFEDVFNNIIKVASGCWHMVGLKSDGSVVETGLNNKGQCSVSGWEDIIDISAAGAHTVGLKPDGTVVATGDNQYGQCDVGDWEDIVNISTGNVHTVGLKPDGTVVATGYNNNGRCDVESWEDIVDISAGFHHTVGLKPDGTVVATGDNNYGQCDVGDWIDVVAISGGYSHTVGLKSDGTVMATGDNTYGQCDVDDWKDIVAIAAVGNITIGIDSKGKVYITGDADKKEKTFLKKNLALLDPQIFITE